MAKKQRSESQKAQATTYKGRYEANRRRKLESHLKRQPNDEQAQAALNNIAYRRKKPNTQGGWVAKHLRESPLFKGVTGRKSLKFCGWVKAQMNRGDALGRAQSFEQKKEQKGQRAA